MSRVAKNPIVLPKGVEVSLVERSVTLKGQKGTLTHEIHDLVRVSREEQGIVVAPADESKAADTLAGTCRALLSNMLQGVSKGFEKRLEINGVGYRAQVQGKALNLMLGYSHPVEFKVPEGIAIETPSQTEILVKGIDKQQVGQVAAKIRAYRGPEPYKGKGIRYANEVIVRKETKKAK
jgi:large subunit ribosomal protein L6